MDMTAKGLHVDLSESFVNRFSDQLATILEKYFGRAERAGLTLSKRQGSFVTEVSVNVGEKLRFQASGMARDAYDSLNKAMKALAKQLRRNKRRLREDHSHTFEIPASSSSALESLDQGPLVIAEQAQKLPTLTVAEATRRMEQQGSGWFTFQDKLSQKMAVIYRRDDGNIGWLEG